MEDSFNSAMKKAAHLSEADGHAVFVVERVVVLIWKLPPLPLGIQDCSRVFEMMAPRSFGYLAIVEPTAGTGMAAPVRSQLATMLQAHQSTLAGSAIVFESTGFGASIVRSVVSGLSAAVRPQFPSKVHADLHIGAAWLTEIMRARRISNLDGPALVEAVKQQRDWSAARTKAS